MRMPKTIKDVEKKWNIKVSDNHLPIPEWLEKYGYPNLSKLIQSEKHKKQYHKRQQRFIDRIGKRIYRKPTTCKCLDCKDVAENGIVVFDERHAKYLNDIEGDLRIRYYDSPVSHNEKRVTKEG